MDFPKTAQTSINTPDNVSANTNPPTANDTIYTMPDKFIQTSSTAEPAAKKSGRGKTWILIIVIVVSAIAIISGAVYYVLTSVINQPAADAVIVNNNNVTATTNATTNLNSNSNANRNLNTNSNLNTNGNINGNVNGLVNNANSNVNSNNNVNSNININANTNAGVAVVVVPSKDTDKDNLTNEEEDLYKTKADKPDSDSDGYLDGAEIIAGYDPTNAVSSGRVNAGTLVTTYQSEVYGFSMWYPSTWMAEALSEETPNEILFTSKSQNTAGQFIEILVEKNPTGYNAADWYTHQTGTAATNLSKIVTFDGVEGVLSTDGYTAYFTTSNNAYVVSYRFGNSTEVFFPTTFTMMAKSLKFTKNMAGSTNSNLNTNKTNTNQASNANTTN
ncbi:MAG: thrombospondin type 3 repeat-containing protein [Patescibacteria group bacterium]|jgi:hypothetical protein